jgi:hypothetical protein
MINLKTKHIIKPRDIVWLNECFGEWDEKFEEVNNKFDDQVDDEDEVVEEIRKEYNAPVGVE